MSATTDDLWFFDALARIRVSRGDGDRRPSVIEMTIPAGGMPPLHVHDGDEGFYVLDGEVRFWAGEETFLLGAGGSLLAPRDVPHTYRVEQDARMLFVTEGNFEGFVRAIGRPAEELVPPVFEPTEELFAQAVRAGAEHGVEILGPAGMLPGELPAATGGGSALR